MIARQRKLVSLRQSMLVQTLTVLALAGMLLAITSGWRSAEYDEQYTLQLVAGAPRPGWPEAAFTAGWVQPLQAGSSNLHQIARDLRETDVHPPLYFWMALGWRDLVGPGLDRLRLLSVICSVGALAMVGCIA